MTNLHMYHVVTEKPMELGQVIQFNQNHYNGVYHRVMVCKQLVNGMQPQGELSEYIKSNLGYWSTRMYRELALEKIRVENYPRYPSRMSCLYTTRSLSDAEMWADSFLQNGRKVYQIVKLQANGKVFDGDAYNVFDGTDDEEENEIKAIHYWENQPNPYGKKPLIDGEIQVKEMIKEF